MNNNNNNKKLNLKKEKKFSLKLNTNKQINTRIKCQLANNFKFRDPSFIRGETNIAFLNRIKLVFRIKKKILS